MELASELHAALPRVVGGAGPARIAGWKATFQVAAQRRVRDLPDVIGIVQARVGSSRLPGKILAPLAGRPLLSQLHARLGAAHVAEWWMATSDRAEDDATEAWSRSVGLHVYRGSSEDVLSRFTAIIRDRRPDWIVRVTGDDPFCHGEAVNRLLAARDAVANPVDMLQLDTGGLPLGYTPQLARAEAVLRAERSIPQAEAHHRSHVLSWLQQRGGCAKVPVPGTWPRRPDWRWTVDTPADLSMARAAFGLFVPDAPDLDYPEMVARLDAHPEITSLNRHVRQKSLVEA